MSAFELNSFENPEMDVRGTYSRNFQNLDPRRIREENIIALKVYDNCRSQDCLTVREIGPARAAECVCICGDEHINEGDIITPLINLYCNFFQNIFLYIIYLRPWSTNPNPPSFLERKEAKELL